MITDIRIEKTTGDFEPQRGKIAHIESKLRLDQGVFKKDNQTLEIGFIYTSALQKKELFGYKIIGTFTAEGRFSLHEDPENVDNVFKVLTDHSLFGKTLNQLLYRLPQPIGQDILNAVGLQCQDYVFKFLELKDSGYKRV